MMTRERESKAESGLGAHGAHGQGRLECGDCFESLNFFFWMRSPGSPGRRERLRAGACVLLGVCVNESRQRVCDAQGVRAEKREREIVLRFLSLTLARGFTRFPATTPRAPPPRSLPPFPDTGQAAHSHPCPRLSGLVDKKHAGRPFPALLLGGERRTKNAARAAACQAPAAGPRAGPADLAPGPGFCGPRWAMG